MKVMKITAITKQNVASNAVKSMEVIILICAVDSMINDW